MQLYDVYVRLVVGGGTLRKIEADSPEQALELALGERLPEIEFCPGEDGDGDPHATLADVSIHDAEEYAEFHSDED